MQTGQGRGWASCVNVAASFLYPEICQYCREQWAEAADGFICADCSRQVQFIREPYCHRCGLPFVGEITGPFECANCHEMDLAFTHSRAAVAAEGMVLELIHRWKYQRALWLEPFLSHLLVQEAAPVLEAADWDLIVPVPLHALKQSEREFNQAEHLARDLAAAVDLKMVPDALVRQAATRTQTRLTRSDRRNNMRQAFAPGRAIGAVQDRRILLIDDVLTTGATTSACARVLLDAGGREVCVWTLARGLLQ